MHVLILQDIGDRQDIFSQQMMRRISDAKLKIPDCPTVSSEAKDLLRKLLVADPRQRLGLKGILQHPYSAMTVPMMSRKRKEY